MATYLELAKIKENTGWNDLLSKVRAAVTEKAALIIDSTTPGATALEWAKSTIKNPATSGNDLVNFIIMTGNNNDATITQILSATDSTIQANVNSAVDSIYGA